LLELLIVLVIAATLAAVVLPRFTQLSTAFEVKGGARQLASALRHARSEAITQRRDVALVLDVAQHTFATTGMDKVHALPDGLNLKLLTADTEIVNDARGAIRFFADGSSTGGQITLSTGQRAYVVDVNWLTGRVTIHD
jgi:general secretion pathway protein H